MHEDAWFQSTRPRGARPVCCRGHRIARVVSIHAPAWGATSVGDVIIPTPIVSIHAPAWGATEYAPVRTRQAIVSIHAPAWGATDGAGSRGRNRWFQSTRPRGARHV